jgi:hypothetical protein
VSGGHWGYSGATIRDGLEAIAEDDTVMRRWPRISSALAGLATVIKVAENDMDYDISGDSTIKDDVHFEAVIMQRLVVAIGYGQQLKDISDSVASLEARLAQIKQEIKEASNGN